MMVRDFIPRPDGSRARQFADSTWLVETADGHWHIEAPDLPDIPVPAAEVYAATFSIHGLVSALVWDAQVKAEQRATEAASRQRGDDPTWCRIAAMALRSAAA